jgi:hypothetical protein
MLYRAERPGAITDFSGETGGLSAPPADGVEIHRMKYTIIPPSSPPSDPGKIIFAIILL